MSGLLASLGLGFVLALAESGLGLGVVMPGEAAIVVLAATLDSPVQLALLALAVTVGASAGDHVGYLIGRRYGDRLRTSRVVGRLGVRHYDRATDLLQRHGGRAVFLTRLLPIVRTLTPAAAGASGLAYARFLPASLAGSMLWASVYVTGGTVLAGLGEVLHKTAGRASWLVVVGLVVLTLPVLVVRAATGVRPATADPTTQDFERRARPADPVLAR